VASYSLPIDELFEVMAYFFSVLSS